MVLKALMLKKEIDTAKKALEELKKEDFSARESELMQAIEQAETKEERETVERAIETFEADKRAHKDKTETLTSAVKDLERRLAETEQKQAQTARKDEMQMHTAGNKNFFGMNLQERNAFFADTQVRSFLDDVRTAIREKRTIQNVGLTIPEVMLPLLKQVMEQTSKLLNRVHSVNVSGTARQVIMGDVPEAVWTEMCATLNALDLGFNDIEVDGYKVGGYFAVCNAVLADNDVNLAGEIIETLGRSIGRALDKAIVYGTGTKMPLGIVTRLAQTEEPANYLATARPWTDVSASNVLTGTGATGVALFKEIVANTAPLLNDYFQSGLTWVMNKKTHMHLIVNSMDKNLNAAIVAGISDSMPVIGGDIVELPFVPDNHIIYGYFDAYLLAERAGTVIEQSREVRFIEDQTVFRGTARYDGQPVIAEAFGVMTITAEAPETSVTFAEDTVNS